jgi:8-oxo-dGTP pyrophosphatase MutT (NUDIX family)
MDIQDPNKDNIKKLYCLNCGKNGHITKKCLCPIISIGIICIKLNIDEIELNSIISYSKKIQNKYLFSIDEIHKLKKLKKKIDLINNDNFDNIIEYLLIRRKNSLNYVEFIRGKYDINNSDYLQKTINFITKEEKNLIRTQNFDILWKDLWGEEINNTNLEYKESQDKFNQLKNGLFIKKNEINLFFSLDKLINDSIYNFYEPEWGFPKGRRNSKEKNIDCAKREFEEETTINNINIVNITPLEETYIASNNLKYKHIYYISQINDKNYELKIDNNNLNQKIEIGDIRWFNFKESLNIIRDYNIEKKNILFNLHLNIKYTIDNFKKILEIFLNNNNI